LTRISWKYFSLIYKFINITLKQKHLQNSNFYVPRKQLYFGFQYINEKLFKICSKNVSVKFVQNISNLISKIFNFIKCVPYFKRRRSLLSYFSSKIKEISRILRPEFMTKRALCLRLREHQANCRNHKQNSAVVDHSENRLFIGL
jgi:hypothetical protein